MSPRHKHICRRMRANVCVSLQAVRMRSCGLVGFGSLESLRVNPLCLVGFGSSRSQLLIGMQLRLGERPQTNQQQGVETRENPKPTDRQELKSSAPPKPTNNNKGDIACMSPRRNHICRRMRANVCVSLQAVCMRSCGLVGFGSLESLRVNPLCLVGFGSSRSQLLIGVQMRLGERPKPTNNKELRPGNSQNQPTTGS